jgi:Recombinase
LFLQALFMIARPLPTMSTIAPRTINKGVFMWTTSGAAAPQPYWPLNYPDSNERTMNAPEPSHQPLAHLLRNRFYIGEVAFKDEVLKGEQQPILDRDLFDAVQAKLDEQSTNRRARRTRSDRIGGSRAGRRDRGSGC